MPPENERQRVVLWQRVVFAADCDEDGNCPVCHIDYAECPCPGPHSDEHEFEERDGVLYARRVGETS